eukprot:CAMPEP_0185253738 /NCGR_PEP_ID=MMETSP1359-20130426/2358_1 /TAXON_ID=552665 /ORGANISM="Bigelowiella longifila, Strain CCMP242" /LENGTH=286 /DNA_ID=CAMNT_0027836157 /DNA_START=14 /DNA_END=874 /DNA_ORIENTATION=-
MKLKEKLQRWRRSLTEEERDYMEQCLNLDQIPHEIRDVLSCFFPVKKPDLENPVPFFVQNGKVGILSTLMQGVLKRGGARGKQIKRTKGTDEKKEKYPCLLIVASQQNRPEVQLKEFEKDQLFEWADRIAEKIVIVFFQNAVVATNYFQETHARALKLKMHPEKILQLYHARGEFQVVPSSPALILLENLVKDLVKDEKSRQKPPRQHRKSSASLRPTSCPPEGRRKFKEEQIQNKLDDNDRESLQHSRKPVLRHSMTGDKLNEKGKPAGEIPSPTYAAPTANQQN